MIFPRLRWSPVLAWISALVLLAGPAEAQQRIQSRFLAVSPTQASSDAMVQDSVGLISPKVVEREDQGKSTNLAMLLSAVVPGAGQMYAERYWTIPVIWGFGLYFYSQYKRGDDLYRDYQSQYASSLAADTVSHQGNLTFLRNQDFYRDERDRFAIYMALTYVINLVDAYVGAAMYGFDVSDNLGGGKSIRFKLRLK